MSVDLKILLLISFIYLIRSLNLCQCNMNSVLGTESSDGSSSLSYVINVQACWNNFSSCMNPLVWCVFHEHTPKIQTILWISRTISKRITWTASKLLMVLLNWYLNFKKIEKETYTSAQSIIEWRVLSVLCKYVAFVGLPDADFVLFENLMLIWGIQFSVQNHLFPWVCKIWNILLIFRGF